MIDKNDIVVECKNISHWFDCRDDNKKIGNLWQGNDFRKKFCMMLISRSLEEKSLHL